MAGGENLGASFGIDVTNLKAGLATANKLIRESESEFKAAAAGMEDWRNSEEGLNAQIKNLNTVTDLQQKKVNALQSEYDRLIADGLDPASDQAIKLRTQINNETAALNKNKSALSAAEDALENLGDEAEDAADSVEDTGDAAKNLNDGFTVAKGAVAGFIANGLTALVGACKNAVGALLGLAGETQQQATNMAKLESAFTTTGKTAEQATDIYKEFYGVLGDADKSTEAVNHLAELTNSQKELDKWTTIATGVYAKFGDSLPIEGLTEAANETAKVGQVTGPLADALNWAGASEDEFNEKLAECNSEQERATLITDTLNGLYEDAAKKYEEVNADVIAANKAQAEYDDTMKKFGDKMRPIMTEVKKGFTELLNAALDMVEGVDFDALAESIKNAFSYFIENILPKIKEGLSWIKDNKDTIIAGIVGIGAAFAAFKVVTLIQSVVGALKGMTLAQAALNLVMSMNPIGLVVAAIAGLIAAFVMLWNNCDSFREFWIDLWNVIKSAFVKTWNSIKNFFTNKIPEMFRNIITWFSNFRQNIADALGQALSNVVKWLSNLVSKGKSGAQNFLNGVISFFKKLPGEIWTWLKNALSKVSDFVGDMKDKAVEAGKGFFDKLVGEISKLPGKMLDIGGEIVNGIWEGISDGWDWLTKKVKKLANSLFDAAKDALGINSPSKVFADGVGKNIALGIGQGYEKAMPGVSDKISGSLAALSSDSAAAVSTSGGAAGGRSVVVNQYNNYAQAHSRFEIYKSKQQTAAAVKLAMMGG